MSAVSDLIERSERESGARWDDPDNNNARNILLGALSRELGQHNFTEKDDFAVGLLIQDEIENGEQKRRQAEALRTMLGLGMSMDDIRALNGNGKP